MSNTTNNELSILVKDFDAPKDIASSITNGLSRFFEEAKAHNATIESIVITDPSEKDKMQIARTIRLQIRQKRLEAKKIMQENRDRVKAAMASYTLEDKLWLKAFQMLEAVCDNLETKAEEKEKFAERWEAEQKEKRTSERLLKLSHYSENDQYTDRNIIENMADDAFDRYFSTIKTQYEAKIEAEKKAEAERIAREKADAEERERIRKENERLRKEAEEREKAFKAEQERLRKEREAAEAKARAERMEIERKAEQERKAAEVERIRQEQEIAKERAERERLQREHQEREAAEARRIEQERKEAQRREKAPDKEKIVHWVQSFGMPPAPSVKSDEMEVIKKEIIAKFNAFKAWAQKMTETTP